MDQITVYGAPWCPDCRRSKAFLTDQRIPFRWVNVDEDADGLRFIENLQGGGRSIPTITFADGTHVIEPSNAELAARLGLNLRASRTSYDLVIIGGGPAGLSAAIYAAREGMDALVLERGALGGQAGGTDRIDNYPGFPDGIGGAELAERLIAHARRYGVEMVSAADVVSISSAVADGGPVTVTTAADNSYQADAVLVATGSKYRRLGVPGEEGLIGIGVHYCATCDGPFYRGKAEVAVIGGGNSALEEALFLVGLVDRVRILARGDLRASELVADKVRSHPRIDVHTGVDIIDFEQVDGRLGGVLTRDRATGEKRRFTPAGAFVFVGLDPNTQFLRGAVDLDERGFVIADGMFRTSLPGVFVAGDARAGSTKQVGSAVGEGIAALLAARRTLEDRKLRTPHAMDEAAAG